MGFVQVGAAICVAISWIEAILAVTLPGGWAGAGGAVRASNRSGGEGVGSTPR